MPRRLHVRLAVLPATAIIAWLLTFVAGIGRDVAAQDQPAPKAAAQDASASTAKALKDATPGKVARVIDGDTVQLEGGERVRLVDVDCCTAPAGRSATRRS